jgi:hypothetical protein
VTELKKYAIYTPARTGSTLYANLLAFYYIQYFKVQNPVYWQVSGPSYDPNSLILHLHNLKTFTDLDTDYVKILTTRSILDSAVSLMIANITGEWHLPRATHKKEYVQKFQYYLWRLDPDKFREHCHTFNQHYTLANQAFDQFKGEKYILKYNTHAEDLTQFFPAVGIDYTINSDINAYPIDMSNKCLDKFQLVANLQELIDIYQSLNLNFDYDDSVTIQKVKDIIYSRR